MGTSGSEIRTRTCHAKQWRTIQMSICMRQSMPLLAEMRHGRVSQHPMLERSGQAHGAADLSLGILYTLALYSLGVYGVLLAGWSANSKYAFLGSLRSTAAMISYELILSWQLHDYQVWFRLSPQDKWISGYNTRSRLYAVDCRI